MAKVVPFKAWRYAGIADEDLNNYVVPPYDVISPQERDALQKNHEHNFTHIILSQGDNKHKLAAQKLQSWKQKNVLKQDPEPGFYFYKQEFCIPAQDRFMQTEAIQKFSTFTRYGLFGLVQLEDYSAKVILPHEKTFSKYKDDRYELMKETNGQMEPVFLGYDSQKFTSSEFEKLVGAQKPVAHYKDNQNVIHTLWLVNEAKTISVVTETLSKEKLYILDGHHRYETALKYSKDSRDPRAGFVLAALSSFVQPGMVILPTHRLFKGFKDFSLGFLKERLFENFDFKKCLDFVELERTFRNTSAVSFGLAIENDLYCIEYKKAPRATNGILDLDVLHNEVLESEEAKSSAEIHYVRSTDEFFNQLQTESFQFGLLVRPNTYSDVVFKASNSEVMPHKSTFFFPKIPSGLVINIF